MNFLRLLLILFICCGAAWAQAPKESSETIRQLLSAPAPPPGIAENSAEQKQPRPSNFFDKDKAPADNAPIEDLFDYWARWAYAAAEHPPSDTVRQHLLNAGLENLQLLIPLLPLFSVHEDEVDKIKEAFEKTKNNSELRFERDEIKKWLLFNSKHFMGELLSLANKVQDRSDSDYVENEEALVALAKLDWSSAKPLLETLVNTGQQRSSTLALKLLYRHSIKEKDLSAELKFRSQLQSIASNRNFPGGARADAIKELSKSEWSGRDEWYLSLVDDNSLIQLRDGNTTYSPLSILFTMEPEKWIPVMTK